MYPVSFKYKYWMAFFLSDSVVSNMFRESQVISAPLSYQILKLHHKVERLLYAQSHFCNSQNATFSTFLQLFLGHCLIYFPLAFFHTVLRLTRILLRDPHT